MTTPAWQRERAKTRQPYLAKIVILAGTPCYACTHPRSSHSLLHVLARCRAEACTCATFDPICGCGHLLCMHSWGTPPNPWSCCQCPCKCFGAVMEVA
jgi:hypothetical protein